MKLFKFPTDLFKTLDYNIKSSLTLKTQDSGYTDLKSFVNYGDSFPNSL